LLGYRDILHFIGYILSRACFTLKLMAASPKLLLLLLIGLPMAAIAQSSVCTIHVAVEGAHEPAQAYLFQAKTPQKQFDFTGRTALIPDTIDHPLIATVLVTYKGEGNRSYKYAVYVVPGELTLRIDRDDTVHPVQVTGAALSQDYQNELLGPVMNYNHRISLLQQKLKQAGSDSTEIRTTLNKTIGLCFGVPKAYVRKHPDSPLDITALKMMGKGDPTVANPPQELATLFQSLAPEVRNSEEGKGFKEKMTSP
jgi:hypothetical protein